MLETLFPLQNECSLIAASRLPASYEPVACA